MRGGDEKELLAAAIAGDAGALEALLEKVQPKVYQFGLRLCGDREDAEDVSQETLLAMARGLRDFRAASSLSTWLYAVARSYCIKKRRRGGAAHEVADEGAAAEPLVDPARPADEALAGKRLEKALAEAIQSLPPKYREVLILRDVEGLTAPQVAEDLGIGLAAVKSRLHRARNAVRDALAPMFAEVGATPSPDR